MKVTYIQLQNHEQKWKPLLRYDYFVDSMLLILRYEILLSTKFSTTFSSIFSTIFENVKKLVYQYLKQLLTAQLHFHKIQYTSSFQKRLALHRRCFQKHPLFTTFLLVFTVDEVCNISNKYQPPNNFSKISILLHKRLYIPPSLRNKVGVFLCKRFFKISTFYHIFTIINVE